MATKLPGETYRGEALHIPLSSDGQITAYVWPLRILTVRGQGCGGPTIGVDVGNEEVVRFDCHDALGHWHGGGYDRLQSPGESHRDFPQGVKRVADQVAWALEQIEQQGTTLLQEAEHHDAAKMLEPALVHTAIEAITSHLAKHAALRPQAIEEKLITP